MIYISFSLNRFWRDSFLKLQRNILWVAITYWLVKLSKIDQEKKQRNEDACNVAKPLAKIMINYRFLVAVLTGKLFALLYQVSFESFAFVNQDKLKCVFLMFLTFMII